MRERNNQIVRLDHSPDLVSQPCLLVKIQFGARVADRLLQTYREIAEDITAKIDDGTYPYGSMLPSARELAAEYGVAMATIHRAMALLAEAEIIIGRQGRGRYVNRR